MAKKRKRKKRLTEQEKEQNLQQKEIRTLMSNLGFSRISRIDGKQFIYNNRTSELDDIFFFENIILLAEYTIQQSVGDHLLKKKIIYDKISENPAEFIKHVLKEEKLKSFKEAYDSNIATNYSLNQLQIRVIYSSKYSISKEHKELVQNIVYLDYPLVKYFESIAKVIKKTTRHEFLDFLNIDFSKVGANILGTSRGSTNDFSGHILPEEHSTFKEGYKIVSFYIDADSLLKRAFVLRNDGWRSKENIGHYQRMFVAKKIRDMRKYLHEEERVFINNIIVTLPIEKIKLFDQKENELEIDINGNFKNNSNTKVQPTIIKIANEANIIGIIDGQHRSFAYHEGDDIYEKSIKKLRGIQNLLVTGILYPKAENEQRRLMFEAKLFLEINSNQSGAPAKLKQEIEFMMNPYSTISISKYIIEKLNESGPLATMFEQYFYESSKIKTASIISFGLKPLVKFEGNDSLYKIWDNPNKVDLKNKADNFTLLQDYKDFCTKEVRNILIGLKANIPKDNWVTDRGNPDAILSVTTINGIINCLRFVIENNKNGDAQHYINKLSNINGFKFKDYKSSQYRKMGEAIYKRCFV